MVKPLASADQDATQLQPEGSETKKRPTPMNKSILRTKMDSLVTAASAGRRFHSQKPYLFFFCLVFTACLSIYRSSLSSEGELQSLWQQYYESQFSPSQLEDKPLLGGNSSNSDMENKREGQSQVDDARKMKQTSEEEQTKENEHISLGDEPVEIDKPMNIVLLYADDWRHDDLGVASNGTVHTPFLDWMSETQGIRFTHNCVTTSVCWISRATLHTGQYYSRHQATRPRDNGWYEGFNTSYPALLRKSGYHVSHIGKWHSADFGQIKHHYHHSKVYYGKHWYPGSPRPIHATERNERDALEMLQSRPKDQPFVLTVAFFAPHSWDGHPDVYLPQNETFHLYQNLTVKPKIDMEASFKRLPKLFTERNEGRVRYRQRFKTPELYDRMMKNYWRLISGVDSACESVWKELEAQGILNETMVIFTTDNGYYHGEHGLAGKWYPHEESIRVPLIVYDPRMPPKKKGTTDDSFTLNIDLAATILGAANISKPDTHQGRDISDLYLLGNNNNDNLVPPWRTEFFYEHPIHINQQTIPASSALVRKQIKYVTWPNFDVEQIFNLTSDPMEEEDQILNPEYAGIHGELKARHDALRDLAAREHTEL